jgi:uncharacterized membrane protein YfcA
MTDLLLGGSAVAIAGFLGGVTGFGYAIVATPLLLATGFSLPFVVTANLALALATRVTVVVRLRQTVDWRRAGLLVAGSVPGLYLGAATLRAVDPTPIKIGVSVLVIGLAVVLAVRTSAPAGAPVPGAPVAAGFAGGFLGTMSSLNGVPPALLLTRRGVAPRSFIADLAAYFVASNTIGLVLLFATGAISHRALFPAAVVWLPGSIVANAIGVALAPRLPERWFRRLTLAIVFTTGVVTLLSTR